MVVIADEHLNRAFSALAHPIRRAILTRLSREGSASVSELAQPFDVSLMAVSKHLAVMADAGLVLRERDGRVRRCSFNPEGFEAARDWIETHRRFWNQQLDSLAAYLEGPQQSRDGGVGEEELHHQRGEDE